MMKGHCSSLLSYLLCLSLLFSASLILSSLFSFEERFADRMSREKETSRILQKKVRVFLFRQLTHLCLSLSLSVSLSLSCSLSQLEQLIQRQHEEENLLSQSETRNAELRKEVDSLLNWKVNSPTILFIPRSSSRLSLSP
jgi:hypothetical protein